MTFVISIKRAHNIIFIELSLFGVSHVGNSFGFIIIRVRLNTSFHSFLELFFFLLKFQLPFFLKFLFSFRFLRNWSWCSFSIGGFRFKRVIFVLLWFFLLLCYSLGLFILLSFFLCFFFLEGFPFGFFFIGLFLRFFFF